METVKLKAGTVNSHYKFSQQLGDNYLDFVQNYISYTDVPAWSLDIYRDGSALALGAMLEPGCDVIESYRAGIGRLVFTGKSVTLDNLGIDNQLIWVEDVE
ncbi:MAG: phage baseplate plug family protein [Plesiomonas shigelloides]